MRRVKLSSAKRARILFILAIIPFAAAGADAAAEENWAWAGIYALAVAMNLAAMRRAENLTPAMHASVNIMNAFIAFGLARDALLAGKSGLPYAWAVAGFAFLVAASIPWLGARDGGASAPAPPAPPQKSDS